MRVLVPYGKSSQPEWGPGGARTNLISFFLALGFVAMPCGSAAQADRPLSTAASDPTPVAARPSAAERLQRPGLPNLGRVTPNLYRGAQPYAYGYDELRKMDIDIFINLNTSRREIEQERARVESRGMRYVSIPWSPLSVPEDAQIEEFLRLLRESPDKAVFVHCQHGADRTGVMVAVFRMARQGWTPDQALVEMQRFNFHAFWYRHLTRYVREFPAKLKTSPTLLGEADPATEKSAVH